MDRAAVNAASEALAAAWTSGTHIDQLPAGARPASADDVFAIQDALIARLKQKVVGWKVSKPEGQPWIGGPVLESRLFNSGAKVPAQLTPMRGVEAEIAFRFERDLPPRASDYTYDEVADAVIAFIGIEIVDSRFTDYKGAAALDKSADLVSNGGFIGGPATPGWRKLDLENIGVTLRINGEIKVQRKGGHRDKDPLIPAVGLANLKRLSTGIKAGQFATTGTYTGLIYAQPGDSMSATFDGMGTVEFSFLK